jgi:hypothetical protein
MYTMARVRVEMMGARFSSNLERERTTRNEKHIQYFTCMMPGVHSDKSIGTHRDSPKPSVTVPSRSRQLSKFHGARIYYVLIALASLFFPDNI